MSDYILIRVDVPEGQDKEAFREKIKKLLAEAVDKARKVKSK